MDYGRTYAHMAHYYHYKAWDVDRLSYVQLYSYIEQIKELEFRKLYAPLAIKREVELIKRWAFGFEPVDPGAFEDEFPGWANVLRSKPKAPPPYSHALVTSLRAASKVGKVSNRMLRFLNTDKLAESGYYRVKHG